MPGPLIQPKPLPDYINPDKAQPDDSLFHTLLRKAVGLSGWNDPNNQVINNLMPEVGPLISIYPNKDIREAATEAFRQSSRELPSHVQAAADWLAQKYPRVAAHMRLNPQVIPNAGEGINPISPEGFQANIGTPAGKVKTPMPVTFTQSGINKSTNEVRGTMAHEATHAAQALGNSDFTDLYNAGHNLGGYNENPMEITARRRGTAVAWGEKPHIEKTYDGAVPLRRGDELPAHLREGLINQWEARARSGKSGYTDWYRGEIDMVKDAMQDGSYDDLLKEFYNEALPTTPATAPNLLEALAKQSSQIDVRRKTQQILARRKLGGLPSSLTKSGDVLHYGEPLASIWPSEDWYTGNKSTLQRGKELLDTLTNRLLKQGEQ